MLFVKAEGERTRSYVPYRSIFLFLFFKKTEHGAVWVYFALSGWGAPPWRGAPWAAAQSHQPGLAARLAASPARWEQVGACSPTRVWAREGSVGGGGLPWPAAWTAACGRRPWWHFSIPGACGAPRRGQSLDTYVVILLQHPGPRRARNRKSAFSLSEIPNNQNCEEGHPGETPG